MAFRRRMFPGFDSKEELVSELKAELHPPDDPQARSHN